MFYKQKRIRGTGLALPLVKLSNFQAQQNMETASRFEKPSPLMNIAAVAIIIASLAAVGAIVGLIPAAYSQKQDAVQVQQDPITQPRVLAGSGKPGEMSAAACLRCGVVESIRSVEVKGQGSGVGAVAGGVAGAVVGSQFGRGNGRTALGVLGAAGGAYAGHEIEKNLNKSTLWRVTVRMEDGASRTLSQRAQPSFAVGEKVKVINGALIARG